MTLAIGSIKIPLGSPRPPPFQLAVSPILLGIPGGDDTLIAPSSGVARSTPPQVVLVGDREIYNLTALFDHTRRYSEPFQVSGFIVPGIDTDIRVSLLTSRQFGSDWFAYAAESTDPRTNDLFCQGPGGTFSFIHHPYDPKQLKANPDARRIYCEALLAHISGCAADLVVLSNFKLVLDAVVPRTLPERVLNVHPSVLPALKGFRPEDRAANQGEHATENGYTIHHVDASLDGGATLFQQRVELPPVDSEMRAFLGDAFDSVREEQTRLSIIRAQAQWMPTVIHMVLSNTPRKIVTDLEAFTAEGRPEYFGSPIHHDSLTEDYAHYQAQTEKPVSFEDWKTHVRKPYERVLFDVGDGYRTLESIFGAPASEKPEGPLGTESTYAFFFSGTNAEDAETRLQRIFQDAFGGLDLFDSAHLIWNDAMRALVCMITTPYDISQVLAGASIDFQVAGHPTRVRSPRRTEHEV